MHKYLEYLCLLCIFVSFLFFSLDVLLDDDEFGDGDGDYDIQDDEENALLEDGNDSVDNKNDDEGDILELDENVEISDGSCTIYHYLQNF